MEMKKGYKMTEMGTIPEDWEIVRVNDLLELLTDFEANGSFEKTAQNVRVFNHEEYAWYVRATDLENSTPLSKLKYVNESTYRFLKKTSLFGGELLITKRGEIGKVYLFQERTHFATLGPNLYLLKLNQKVLPYYLFLYFVSNTGNKILRKNDASTTLGALYKDDVKSMPVPLPPTLTEQRAIATALSDVDRLLSACDQLIAKKKAIKQGAMQELLTGRRRLEGFEGEWRDWKVGAIGYTYSGLTGKTKEDFDRGDGRYITFLNVMNNVRIDINILESVNVNVGEHQNTAQVGDLFFNTSSETPGEVGMCAVLLEDVSQVYLNSFCFGFRLHEGIEIEPIYLAYYFRSSVGRNAFFSLAQGATRYNLSKSNFNNITLNLPQLDEQHAIAQILTDMDAEIAALEQQRDKYKAVKAGMMQELLTGKTRLI